MPNRNRPGAIDDSTNACVAMTIGWRGYVGMMDVPMTMLEVRAAAAANIVIVSELNAPPVDQVAGSPSPSARTIASICADGVGRRITKPALSAGILFSVISECSCHSDVVIRNHCATQAFSAGSQRL